MAAQEKAKQTQSSTQAPASSSTTFSTAQDPPPAFDLLDATFNQTSTQQTLVMQDPPPSFDAAVLQAPPPAFDESLVPPPITSVPPQQTYAMFDPLAAPAMAAPPAPSAPTMEEVYVMPPPSQADAAMDPWSAPHATSTGIGHSHYHTEQPQAQDGLDPAVVEAIMSLDGLSEADKRALIEEQRQALQQMKQQSENQRPPSTAASAADAFEQRSLAMSLRQQQQPSRAARTVVRKEGGTHAGIPTDASLASQLREAQASSMVAIGAGQQAPLHGPEKTQQAIANGTALIVQCLGCEHAMQVTPAATLMFCPVCETISAVNDSNTILSSVKDEAAAQMEADLKLAEELQKEEYKRAAAMEDAGSARRSSPSARSTHSADDAAASSASSGWLEWLGVSSTTQPATSASSPRNQSAPSPSRTGLVAANTESITFSSRDPMQQQARVAESKPLFSCVADSIMTTANQYMASALMDAPDEEGNVHGVDSTSLLAVPMSGIGRNAGSKSDEASGYQAYGN